MRSRMRTAAVLGVLMMSVAAFVFTSSQASQKGNKQPLPTPTPNQPPRPVCPNVAIYCPDVQQAGAPITFTASVSGGTPGITPVYNWKISAGTILSGQGTPTITVDTAGLAGQPISAVVEVAGYNLE